MRKVHIIGIGAGDPNYLTVQAIDALNEVDVFFIPDKGAEKLDLKQLRIDICARFLKDRTYRTVEFETPKRDTSPDYKADVAAWHALIAKTYARLLMAELADGECGGFLVWGDPTLYDSTLRIIAQIQADGVPLDYDVIPGISSVQALAAKHKVPLNRIGEPVAIIPGRKLAEGCPGDIEDVVVVLDGDLAFKRVVANDPDIFWGAYVGTKDEILIAGRLSDVMEEIETVRARKKREKGWIMDSYLLRKSDRSRSGG